MEGTGGRGTRARRGSWFRGRFCPGRRIFQVSARHALDEIREIRAFATHGQPPCGFVRKIRADQVTITG